MRWRHAMSPAFSGHYQDLDMLDVKSHDSACNIIPYRGEQNIVGNTFKAARSEPKNDDPAASRAPCPYCIPNYVVLYMQTRYDS